MKGFRALDIIINIYVYSFIPLCIHFIPKKKTQVRQRRIHRIRLELKCEWYKFCKTLSMSQIAHLLLYVQFFFSIERGGATQKFLPNVSGFTVSCCSHEDGFPVLPCHNLSFSLVQNVLHTQVQVLQTQVHKV